MIQLVYSRGNDENCRFVDGQWMYRFGFTQCHKYKTDLYDVVNGTIIVTDNDTFLKNLIRGVHHVIVDDNDIGLSDEILKLTYDGHDISIFGGPKLLERGVKYSDKIIETVYHEHIPSKTDIYIPDIVDHGKFVMERETKVYLHNDDDNLHSYETKVYVKRKGD